ncbi:hypothetical protein K443DRAFT_111882 [Laccaria amethystina LaAM-08-1]|uniref:Uncharacterized protein n=1 Tax=Laccaria amethystina LaAM-08-1 TaxID=1095629 RepID=A0A0C9X7J0_9AGAR|nr:hypothetical protein K443DRAFT_111882 [Laccaria amethystina LaAM-08-1]
MHSLKKIHKTVCEIELTMARFSSSWARLNTYALPEEDPQNCLRNSFVSVEVRQLLFSTFVLMLTNCPRLTLSCFT